MKRSYIYLLLFLCIISCNSQENQAYKDAIASNSIAALRGYLISYDGNMSKKHLKKAESILNVLVSDSVIYNDFLTAKDTIKKYNICKEYLEQKISGPHSTELKTFEVNQRDYYYNQEKLRFEEIDNMEPSFRSYNLHLKFVDEFPYGKNLEAAKGFIEHNKNAHQQILAELKEMRKVFANYKFNGYEITGPNEYGEGEFSKVREGLWFRTSERNYNNNKNQVLDVESYISYKGKYYVDDDLLMHVDIIKAADSLKFTVKTDILVDVLKKDVSDNEQLKSKYKSLLQNNIGELHFVCGLLTIGEGNYTLRMQERGKDMEYYKGILK